MTGKVTFHDPLPITREKGLLAVECIVHGRCVFPSAVDDKYAHEFAKEHAACAHLESRRIRGRHTPPPRKSRSRA